MDAALLKRLAINTCLIYWVCAGMLSLAFTSLALNDLYHGKAVTNCWQKLALALTWHVCPVALHGGLTILARNRPAIIQVWRVTGILVALATTVVLASVAFQLVSLNVVKNQELVTSAWTIGFWVSVLHSFVLTPLCWLSLAVMAFATCVAAIRGPKQRPLDEQAPNSWQN